MILVCLFVFEKTKNRVGTFHPSIEKATGSAPTRTHSPHCARGPLARWSFFDMEACGWGLFSSLPATWGLAVLLVGTLSIVCVRGEERVSWGSVSEYGGSCIFN